MAEGRRVRGRRIRRETSGLLTKAVGRDPGGVVRQGKGRPRLVWQDEPGGATPPHVPLAGQRILMVRVEACPRTEADLVELRSKSCCLLPSGNQ
ncbi:unnamed protein product [Urochloa humidicola]